MCAQVLVAYFKNIRACDCATLTIKLLKLAVVGGISLMTLSLDKLQKIK